MKKILGEGRVHKALGDHSKSVVNKESREYNLLFGSKGKDASRTGSSNSRHRGY